MKKDVKFIAINSTGIKSTEVLIEPGVTELDFGVCDRNSKIHICDVDLTVGGATTISIFLGTTKIYERVFSAAGEVHSIDRDLFIPDNVIRTLNWSCSGNVTVAGRIFYTLEFTGGASKNSGLY